MHIHQICVEKDFVGEKAPRLKSSGYLAVAIVAVRLQEGFVGWLYEFESRESHLALRVAKQVQQAGVVCSVPQLSGRRTQDLIE
jgi:hypothetical protein